MEEIGALLASPQFWFTTVVCQIVVGLVTNWISNNISANWLRSALVLNAVVLGTIAAFGYSIGEHPLFVNVALGICLAFFYSLPAALPSVALCAFALLALNLPAGWIAWVVSRSSITEPLDAFLTTYLLMGMILALLLQVWIIFRYSHTQILESIELRVKRLFVRDSPG